ncbi:unnamed protein product [Gordionus sp. m RMFG-2023]
MRLAPPRKVIMPYGGKLIWNLPGRNTLNVHMKDRTMIRNKKRWSQVMYMYYLLGQKLWVQIEDIQRKQVRADNTFILTLDGDVDVKPAAAQLLIDLMKKNHKVGAACGRIHPVGAGPMIWYQKFEYAIGHWFQKATEHMIGCVLCSPGCFSLFRASALMDDNVMRKYASKSEKAMHYVQYDQGEDRWLSTLLLQQGYRVEYCAAADAFTHAPEGFFEFYNQRRRWIPSTLANILDLLCSHNKTIQMNDSISFAYIAYQWALLGCALIGPGTIFLMIVGAVSLVFHMNLWKSFALNLVPIICFVFICISADSETQLLVAAFLSACYALLMISVSVGISVQITDDGLTSPSSIFLFVFVGCFFVAALLHPQEFWNIAYGILYFLSIPAMYLLLIVYSLTNLHVVQWGTREVPGADKIDRFREDRKKKRLNEVARSKWKATKLKYLYDNIMQRRIQNQSETQHLLMAYPQKGPTGDNSLTNKLNNMIPNYGYLNNLMKDNSRLKGRQIIQEEVESEDVPLLSHGLIEETQDLNGDILLERLEELISSSDEESDQDILLYDNVDEDEGFAFNCGTLCRLTCCSKKDNKSKTSKSVLFKGKPKRKRNYYSSSALFDRAKRMLIQNPVIRQSHSFYSPEKLHNINENLINTKKYLDSKDNLDQVSKVKGRNLIAESNFQNKKIKQVRINMGNAIMSPIDDIERVTWVNDKSLRKGELTEISQDEETFWKELIETYLYPLDEDEEHKIKIKSDLKSLRNKVILGFYMVNACFILIIFLLQLRKDKIYIVWPWGKKTSRLLKDKEILKDNIEDTFYEEFSLEFLENSDKQYLKLEPIALVFLVVFMFLLITQFVAMLAHRFSTFQLILATTELSFLKCWNKKRGLSRFRSGLRNGKSDASYPPQLTAEQAVALVRELQKLEGLDEEIEYEAQREHSINDSVNQKGIPMNGKSTTSYINGGFDRANESFHNIPFNTPNSKPIQNGNMYNNSAAIDKRRRNGEVFNKGRRSVAQNLARNMSIRADGRLTSRKYTTNTLDAAFAKRFLALSEKINNPQFIEDTYNYNNNENFALDYNLDESKAVRNVKFLTGHPKDIKSRRRKQQNMNDYNDLNVPKHNFREEITGGARGHNVFDTNLYQHNKIVNLPLTNSKIFNYQVGVFRADRNTLRVLADKKDTIFRRDILDELKKETLKLNNQHKDKSKVETIDYIKNNGKKNSKIKNLERENNESNRNNPKEGEIYSSKINTGNRPRIDNFFEK